MKLELDIRLINGMPICIKGVGEFFYSSGFPIIMSLEILKEIGVECSMYHIADECLKNGWTAKTTYLRLTEDYVGSVSKDMLRKFCYTDYEMQREMIFKYLWGTSSSQIIEGYKKNPNNYNLLVLTFLETATEYT